MKVRIMADSTCDLSPELIECYHLTITPLYIEMDGSFRKDGIEVQPTDIFEYVNKTGKLCHTAAVSEADYVEYFGKALEEADGIVHFTISSDMSACYQNAVNAARKFENVHVVDSRNLSTGIALLVIRACEMADQGMAAADIAGACRALTDKVETSFILDTLLYLSKGGRCSSLTAFSVGLLNIKPCIEVKGGKMGVGKKYRGRMEQVLTNYVTERLRGREDIDLSRIFITYSSTTPVYYEAVKKAILDCQPFAEILPTSAGSTVSNHCGPLCLGILYMTKE